jgi:hypothetical protein
MAVGRHRPASTEAPVWVLVSTRRSCSACGASDGCTVAEDAGFAHCRTTVSRWPVLGGGWLHPLADDGAPEREAGASAETA